MARGKKKEIKAQAPVLIKDYLGYISMYDLEGSFTEAAQVLVEKEKYYFEMANQTGKWDPVHSKLVISCEQQQYDDGYELAVYLMRPETEKEQKARIEKEQYAASQRERWERQQYEALAKKFGKK